MTHKKPEPGVSVRSATVTSGSLSLPRLRNRGSSRKLSGSKTDLEAGDPDDEASHSGENGTLWAVGDASDDEGDDEDIDHHQHPLHTQRVSSAGRSTARLAIHGEEGRGLIEETAEDDG